MYVEGEVKNVSGQRLENVAVVASWYASGTYITSQTVLIEYDPILPGQTSPFKASHRLNPAFTSWKLAFKELFGRSLATNFEGPPPPTPTMTPTPLPPMDGRVSLTGFHCALSDRLDYIAGTITNESNAPMAVRFALRLYDADGESQNRLHVAST